ncbi:MAG: aminoacyl-tRNA hydrolase [Candidatus Omnitrophica bacterium]|nr:aminoacyl-tRNA hydrolase [Candidatus Omnitrophota bacterium]
MKVIIGLGNPGKRYEKTRHNVGFMVASTLAGSHGIRLNTKAFNSLIGRGRMLGEEVTIALPQTYMNRSGEAVRAILSRRKTELCDLLVICDDVNLSLGITRIRADGSAGGHNGLASIIEHLGSGDFARLKVGIGKPRSCMQERNTDTESSGLSGYVLSTFKKSEEAILGEAMETSVDCCETWLKGGVERAATRFNLKNRKEG